MEQNKGPKGQYKSELLYQGLVCYRQHKVHGVMDC